MRIETARNVNARIVIISFTTITVQNIALFELFTVWYIKARTAKISCTHQYCLTVLILTAQMKTVETLVLMHRVVLKCPHKIDQRWSIDLASTYNVQPMWWRRNFFVVPSLTRLYCYFRAAESVFDPSNLYLGAIRANFWWPMVSHW